MLRYSPLSCSSSFLSAPLYSLFLHFCSRGGQGRPHQDKRNPASLIITRDFYARLKRRGNERRHRRRSIGRRKLVAPPLSRRSRARPRFDALAVRSRVISGIKARGAFMRPYIYYGPIVSRTPADSSAVLAVRRPDGRQTAARPRRCSVPSRAEKGRRIKSSGRSVRDFTILRFPPPLSLTPACPPLSPDSLPIK